MELNIYAILFSQMEDQFRESLSNEILYGFSRSSILVTTSLPVNVIIGSAVCFVGLMTVAAGYIDCGGFYFHFRHYRFAYSYVAWYIQHIKIQPPADYG